MAVDASDLAELTEIEQAEATAIARRDALIRKWGEGQAVMKAPGDPYVMIVIKGELQAVAVTYLTGGPAK